MDFYFTILKHGYRPSARLNLKLSQTAPPSRKSTYLGMPQLLQRLPGQIMIPPFYRNGFSNRVDKNGMIMGLWFNLWDSGNTVVHFSVYPSFYRLYFHNPCTLAAVANHLEQNIG